MLPAPTCGRPNRSARKLNLAVVRRAASEECELEGPVRNTFNSMPLEVVMEALAEARVSSYFQRMVERYLRSRIMQTRKDLICLKDTATILSCNFS